MEIDYVGGEFVMDCGGVTITAEELTVTEGAARELLESDWPLATWIRIDPGGRLLARSRGEGDFIPSADFDILGEILEEINDADLDGCLESALRYVQTLEHMAQEARKYYEELAGAKPTP